MSEYTPLEVPTDEERCLRCGSCHLDTGWECNNCGFDNYSTYAPKKDSSPENITSMLFVRMVLNNVVVPPSQEPPK